MCLGSAQSRPQATPPDPTADQISRAARAYDQGNCREVLAAYAAVPNADQELSMDGLTQYRWGYCLAQTRQGNAAPHYELAADLLSRETKSPSPRLEAFFYAVNALLNLEKRADAEKIAAAAVARFKAGTLTVSAGDPTGWFQLSKLHRDAGDPKGALVPARRAVEEAEKGAPLRSAYLERIADLGAEQQDVALSRRAIALLAKTNPAAAQSPARDARLLLAAADYAGARDAFRKMSAGSSDAAMDAQYAAAALDRVLELEAWGLKPAPTDPKGRPLSELKLDDLQSVSEDGHPSGLLVETAREAYQAMTGRVVEVPRPKGPGTRPAPLPEQAAKLHEVQARFCGLLIEAIRRNAPLQIWAHQGSYPALFYSPWDRIYVQNNARDRETQLIQTLIK